MMEKLNPLTQQFINALQSGDLGQVFAAFMSMFAEAQKVMPQIQQAVNQGTQIAQNVVQEATAKPEAPSQSAEADQLRTPERTAVSPAAANAARAVARPNRAAPTYASR